MKRTIHLTEHFFYEPEAKDKYFCDGCYKMWYIDHILNENDAFVQRDNAIGKLRDTIYLCYKCQSDGNRHTYFIQNEVSVGSRPTSGTMEKFFYDPYEEIVLCPKCKEPMEKQRYEAHYCYTCQIHKTSGNITRFDDEINNQLDNPIS